jgi:phosphatidylinositol-3,4,5-trisphosphate 3-phosphatase/dual-specificity protein phosphatase PTEN
MKPTTARRGVSIPSQRRWCRYVNLHFTDQTPSAHGLVRLVAVTLKIKALHSWQKPLAKVILGGDSGQGKAWASVARYDDGYVAALRSAESRSGGIGGDGQYDSSKMFRACGKVSATLTRNEEEYVVHRMESSTPLHLDRQREFRLKLHLSSLPLGWAWLIPAFHLPEPSEPGRRHTLVFPRSQIDFAIGPGAAIIDVAVELEEMDDPAAQPAMQLSEQQEKAAGLDEKDRVKEEGE